MEEEPEEISTPEASSEEGSEEISNPEPSSDEGSDKGSDDNYENIFSESDSEEAGTDITGTVVEPTLPVDEENEHDEDFQTEEDVLDETAEEVYHEHTLDQEAVGRTAGGSSKTGLQALTELPISVNAIKAVATKTASSTKTPSSTKTASSATQLPETSGLPRLQNTNIGKPPAVTRSITKQVQPKPVQVKPVQPKQAQIPVASGREKLSLVPITGDISTVGVEYKPHTLLQTDADVATITAKPTGLNIKGITEPITAAKEPILGDVLTKTPDESTADEQVKLAVVNTIADTGTNVVAALNVATMIRNKAKYGVTYDNGSETVINSVVNGP